MVFGIKVLFDIHLEWFMQFWALAQQHSGNYHSGYFVHEVFRFRYDAN
jgi:hypothetical protein